MYKPRILVVAVGLYFLATGTSCSRDVRLAGHHIPKNVQVKTVTHYGQVLDESATPEQVAFVLLRAIKEDFEATTPQDRTDALNIQFDVCAPDAIISKLNNILTRDELLYHVVHHWTPTVGHYVGDIGTEFDQMESRLIRRGLRQVTGAAEGVKECKILVELADPSGDPNASVVLALAMIQEKNHWRVGRLAFAPTIRSLAALSTTKPSNH